MYTTINKYLSLVKFAHTIFAMPFALIGYCMAVTIGGGAFNWLTFGLVILCMVFARSAAMAFNRWLDVDIDKLNPRTAKREIPAGIISKKNAMAFIIANCVLFVATTWFINPVCFFLSPVALLVVLGYSYTKRFTALCHMVLGVGLSLAPIGAYLAVTGQFAVLPVLVSCLVLCWVSGFDIIYSLQDEDFDKSQRLNSIPAWLGLRGALHFSEVLHVIAAGLVITIGIYGHFHWLYWIGAAVFMIMLVSQHMLVKPNDLSRINIMFMTTNGIASVVFAVFAIADMLVLA
ncbi:UbiA-like polyprenyltransferase [Chitinophaga sp. sic0106]|uniref:UbiA-like polyprenyltransferase n=1 Tax=Chitinophaga sp. sic0106 TaxID=2854785 RepID=UPI001C4747B5|nr:UbiA-like polyprenyltransferase [Chitinophaga sp. sic0106]MBV7531918.1 putative 4-hydroxybenzoate polyprenyltransferase [Chitinophaga sp. sic0106]